MCHTSPAQFSARFLHGCTAASILLGFAGCSDKPADTTSPPDMTVLAPWPHELTRTSTFAARRGLLDARAVIHLHSPLSHDACDNKSWYTGPLSAAQSACLSHLRSEVCATHLDFANLTNHAAHVGDVDFATLYWKQDGDTEIRDQAGDLVGMQWRCPDGSIGPIVTVGSENSLMPMGLHHHVLDTTDSSALENAYGGDTVDAVTAFRNAGALVFQNHAEQPDIASLRTLALDGIELYNIHANVDPNIRPMYLGLPSVSYLGMTLKFMDSSFGLEPDLVFMSFFSENGPDLQKWNILLSEGRKTTGITGCDAHENTFPQIMSDGERGDSYRRMIRWATTHELVKARTVDGQVEALTKGRVYVAFEAYGTPLGFDYFANDTMAAGGASAEMGDTVQTGATLHLVAPHLPEGHPASPAPAISLQIVRADASGTGVIVAQGTSATLDFTTTDKGAYYAVVRITPNHTRPYLGTFADQLVKDVPWVYANPIWVGTR